MQTSGRGQREKATKTQVFRVPQLIPQQILKCRKPMIMHTSFNYVHGLSTPWVAGSNPAGIANDFNEMRVLFSLNPCTMPQ
jgi:hypothetical protein